MGDLVNKPDHRNPLTSLEGKDLFPDTNYQAFFDALEEGLNDNLLGAGVQLKLTAKADLANINNPRRGMMRYITDEAGGEVPAFFDGTNWRRCTDRAIVS